MNAQIVKKIWNHTSNTKCDWCGEEIPLDTDRDHTYTAVVGEEADLHLCPHHMESDGTLGPDLTKWAAFELGISEDRLDLVYQPGLHQ